MKPHISFHEWRMENYFLQVIRGPTNEAICVNCAEMTLGPRCERCSAGHYRSTKKKDSPCLQCKCNGHGNMCNEVHLDKSFYDFYHIKLNAQIILVSVGWRRQLSMHRKYCFRTNIMRKTQKGEELFKIYSSIFPLSRPFVCICLSRILVLAMSSSARDVKNIIWECHRTVINVIDKYNWYKHIFVKISKLSFG